MAAPRTLQDSFARGMRRDIPRHKLPANVAWNLVDYIPDVLEAPLEKRGGYTYFSDDITGTVAAATYVIAGMVAPFGTGAGTKHLAVTEDNRLVTITASNGDVTDIGDIVAGTTMKQNPVFHREKAIFPAGDGSTAPRYYDGTTLGNLAGSPPAGIYATVHKDTTVLANTNANPNRAFFSDAGDPTTWDPTNNYWDFTYPVTGIASIKNAILGFAAEGTERLIGSSVEDFTFGPVFDEGTPDARSIAYWGDNLCFANPSGIFITDGSALDDLTAAAGMHFYWSDLLESYTSSYTLVGGVYRSYYIIAVMDGSSFVDAAMIDLARRTWLRLGNWKARAMWTGVAPDELYFGLRSAARVAKTSAIFSPAAATKADADGTAVTPIYESPFFSEDGHTLSWRRFYMQADIRDAASDNPVLSVGYVTSPESTSYTTLTDTFAETTALARRRLAFDGVGGQGVSNDGMGFKVTQTAASATTRIHNIAAEVTGREKSRIAA